MISVIVPVYNCEKYIEECISSIVAQEQDNVIVEIIIVDDGSTDRTNEICERCTKKYSEIILLHQDNAGVSAARNYGLSVASGKWITFVDADDIVPQGAFSQLLMQSSNDVQLVSGSILMVGACEPSYLFAKEKIYTAEMLAYDIMTHRETRLAMSGVWGKLFRKDIIDINSISFNEKYVNGEDGLFLVDYLAHISTIVNLRDFPPVYFLKRYDQSERISAVSSFYPDFFEFHKEHSERLAKIVIRDNMDYFKQKYINELIIYLIRAYAYKDFWFPNTLHNKVKIVLSSDLVRESIRIYRRENRNQSFFIPLAIRLNNCWMLEKCLGIRGKKYLKIKGKSNRVKSIYR